MNYYYVEVTNLDTGEETSICVKKETRPRHHEICAALEGNFKAGCVKKITEEEAGSYEISIFIEEAFSDDGLPETYILELTHDQKVIRHEASWDTIEESRKRICELLHVDFKQLKLENNPYMDEFFQFDVPLPMFYRDIIDSSDYNPLANDLNKARDRRPIVGSVLFANSSPLGKDQYKVCGFTKEEADYIEEKIKSRV